MPLACATPQFASGSAGATSTIDIQKGAARRQALLEARFDDAHAVLRGGPRVAEEQVEGLRVGQRRALDPFARRHVLEPFRCDKGLVN